MVSLMSPLEAIWDELRLIRNPWWEDLWYRLDKYLMKKFKKKREREDESKNNIPPDKKN